MTETSADPLFILSFRQRDELADAAVRAGWRPVAARRSEGLDRRLAVSGAKVVVIDARGAIGEGLEAARAIGGTVAAGGQAMLVLVSRGDATALDDFHAAGATHFLASPMREIELVEALRFARRHAERVSGGWVAETRRVEPLGWRYDHARRSLQLTSALAALVQVGAEGPAGPVLARVPRDLRPMLATSLRRLASEGSAAFAHDLPGVGRVVQHLQRDARSGRIHALVEPLGETPDATAVVRDLFPRRSRSIAALARDLPGGLERGEIDVLFQPQVEIASDRITGVEALARWQHPRLGEIGAEALLAAAEHGGKSVDLSAYLQDCAFRAAVRWPAALDQLRLSVNVAAADIASPEFVDRLLSRIDDSGFPRERVTIEITESGLIENLGEAATLLGALRHAGCRVAIDDFGTGYSSLAYLSALPLDYLKLDKAMTDDIGRAARDRIIVRGVIDMAHSLGLAVIAEGVESTAQRDLLAAEGCRFYQGFLCSPPVDSGMLAELVRGRSG